MRHGTIQVLRRTEVQLIFCSFSESAAGSRFISYGYKPLKIHIGCMYELASVPVQCSIHVIQTGTRLSPQTVLDAVAVHISDNQALYSAMEACTRDRESSKSKHTDAPSIQYAKGIHYITLITFASSEPRQKTV